MKIYSICSRSMSECFVCSFSNAKSLILSVSLRCAHFKKQPMWRINSHLSKLTTHIKNTFKSTTHRYRQLIYKTITLKDKTFSNFILKILNLLANTFKIAISLSFKFQSAKHSSHHLPTSNIKLKTNLYSHTSNKLLILHHYPLHLPHHTLNHSRITMKLAFSILQEALWTHRTMSTKVSALLRFPQLIIRSRIIALNICICFLLKRMAFHSSLEGRITTLHKQTQILILSLNSSNNLVSNCFNNGQQVKKKEMK